MTLSEFKTMVQEEISLVKNQTFNKKDTISRSELKEIVKETIRAILKEITEKSVPKKEDEEEEEEINEMTTTSAVAPINLPGNVRGGWVSKQGGSKRGIEGSRSLGYELTPLGAKDFNRKQDPV